MISTFALSVFILHHHLNELCNKNLRSFEEIMRASDPAAKKYKKVCKEFPNLSILTKSSMPEKVQLTFRHATAGNKSLGESVVSFALAGNLRSTFVVSIKIYIAFSADGNKIRILITEVLLRAAVGNLARSKISSNGRRAMPSSSRHSSRSPQFSTGSRTWESF